MNPVPPPPALSINPPFRNKTVCSPDASAATTALHSFNAKCTGVGTTAWLFSGSDDEAREAMCGAW